jgi:integrase
MATFEPRSGNHRAVIRRKGYPTLKKTFKRKVDAEKWARSVENEMDRGVFISRKEAENTTLSELLDRYAHEISELKKGVIQELSIIKILKETDLAKMYISTIQSKHLAKYRDELLQEGLKPHTIKRRFSLLSHLFTIAIKEWGIEGIENQVKKIIIHTKPNSRTRRLLESEEANFLEYAKKHNQTIYNYIILSLEFATRRGELNGIKWEHIELEKRIIHLYDTKNEHDRDIPISIKAKEILENMKRNESGKLFDYKKDSASQAFSRICKRLGIINLRLHDLRHEGVSRLFEKDFNVMEAASVSGHKDLRSLKRYTHLKAENLVEKMR